MNLNDHIEIMKILAIDGMNLAHFPEQTEEMCLAAVAQNGRAIKFVKDQTECVCLVAVKKDPCCLKFIKNKTPKICQAAVFKEGKSIRFVPTKLQTEEICIESVRQNGANLKYVSSKFLTKSLCLSAIKNYPQAINISPYHSDPDFIEESLKVNPGCFRRIGDQTVQNCILALALDKENYKYVYICNNPNHEETLANLINLKKAAVFEKMNLTFNE
jgi:hypothetical protein